MRTTQFLLTTLKETPNEAQIKSHQLMLRAGLVRQLTSGIYTWMPLGLRVLQKVIALVRTAMNNSGALELLMPSVQPAELWQETGRWDQYGHLLLRIVDRNEREFCFGPTHEEVITDIVRQEIRSYKQLPINLYQIQTKFRDEIRPRFGVMRGREFIMKDAYSFHADAGSLHETYQKMFTVYSDVLTAMGLRFRAVLADSGEIGGSLSHEFQVLADAGEDIIAMSDSSNYAANVERAELLPPIGVRPAPLHPMTQVATPDCKTIDEVCRYLNVTPANTIKTLLVNAVDGGLVALLLRGDHELNIVKTKKLAMIAQPLSFASEEDIVRTVGCMSGYLGPVGLTIPVIADYSVIHLTDVICGANKVGYHYQHVCLGRDCAEPLAADLRTVVDGDPSPDGHGVLRLVRGIEVGHIFELGDKYTAAMKATVLNEQGRAMTLLMGCYGMGISRLVAAAIEQHHDERGIIWPAALAPFSIALLGVNSHKSQRVVTACAALYNELVALGYEVLWDDRNERPGVLFADIDLIGIPHRLVISDAGLDEGVIEYKARHEHTTRKIPVAELKSLLSDLIRINR